MVDMTESNAPRYEMINIRQGYIVVEHEIFSHTMRSYFSTESAVPKEEYREGNKVWKYSGMAQSFRFEIKDRESGEITPFNELLGLMYFDNCKPESEIYKIGDLAHNNKIFIYIAITYEADDGSKLNIPLEKLRILNAYFNERLRTSSKKILILPDYFNLYKQLSYGEIMIDVGLTSMEETQ